MSRIPGLVWNSGRSTKATGGLRLVSRLTRHQAVGVVDGIDLLDRAQHGLEVAGVGQLELEAHLGDAVAAGVGAARDDVDVLLAERVGDVAQQARTVEGDHLDTGPEDRLGAVAVPIDVDQPRRLLAHQALGVGAVGAVHRHAAAAGDEADDVVAGHRRAAPRQAHQDVVEPLDVHADGGPWTVAADRAWSARPTRELLAVGALREPAGHLLGDRSGRDVVLADRRQHRVEIGVRAGRDLIRRAPCCPRSAAAADPRGGTPWSALRGRPRSCRRAARG